MLVTRHVISDRRQWLNLWTELQA